MAKKWEYKVVDMDRIVNDRVVNKEELLNALGQEGWELVTVSGDTDTDYYGRAYLKREAS